MKIGVKHKLLSNLDPKRWFSKSVGKSTQRKLENKMQGLNAMFSIIYQLLEQRFQRFLHMYPWESGCQQYTLFAKLSSIKDIFS